MYILNKTITLVGLMGAGKSTIGIRLGKKLDFQFIDTDREIEKNAGCSISEIFSIKGEEYFRNLERETIRKLVEGSTPFIMATGGGAFINPESRKFLQEKTIVIWLKADLEILLERVSRRNNRPLLEKGDKRQILSELMEKRYPIYKNAHITVESNEEPHDKVMDRIIAALSKEKALDYQK